MSPRPQARWLAAALLVTGAALGARAEWSDTTPAPPAARPRLGGYVVLAADLHVHSFLGDGALGPWDILRQARRRELDAVAITNHNRVGAAKLARWLARAGGGDQPLVIVGQEVTAPGYHLIALGIEEVVDWTGSAAAAIRQVHAQGGAAIAAHPDKRYWPAYGHEALAELDGAEIAHPIAYGRHLRQGELDGFFARATTRTRPLAAIGSSDFHFLGSPGLCRTYVFAREASVAAIIEAIRAGRTVAADAHGLLRGDPALVALLAARGPIAPPPGASGLGLGGVLAWLGLAGLLVLGRRRRP